jgi:hypothetical protein
MKKLTLVSLTLIFAMPLLFGQNQDSGKSKVKETAREAKAEAEKKNKLEATTVSSDIMDAFAVDFGNITDAKWKKGLFLDNVEFIKDGKKMTAYYGSDAKLVGTTVIDKFSDIPSKSQAEIKSTYKGYKIGQVLFFNDNKLNDTNMYLWDIEFGDGDNYFVELTKKDSKIIIKVNSDGNVSLFKYLQ